MAEAYSEEWWREIAQNRDAWAVEGGERWANLIESIFPLGRPDEVSWSNIDQIVDVLDQIGLVGNTNHVFCPRGGGFDLTGAGHAGESGCIELLSAGTTTIVKPRKLSFHAIGSDPTWHYFRLEIKLLQPSGLYRDDPFRKHEELCELSPGEYVEHSVWSQGFLGIDEYGNDLELPVKARSVIREFGGSLVIFGKYSPYNADRSTYDGRHNRGTSEQFANYIREQADVK